MNSDLIIMTFPRQDQSFQARQALEMMRGRQLFGLENTALVTRNMAGQAAVHQRWDLPAYPRGRRSRLPVLFADAIFGPAPDPGAQGAQGAPAPAGGGLDDIFVEEVSSALAPDGSALLIYVPAGSLVDTRRLLETLALFHGRLHHTSIPGEVEETILGLAETDQPEPAIQES